MGKFMYIYFLQFDAQMTVFDSDKKELVACSVKNFNLHEDLAQLDYMFCDKTGTLTKNELIFKAFKVLGPPGAGDEVAFESRAKTPETFATSETGSNKLLASVGQVSLNKKLETKEIESDGKTATSPIKTAPVMRNQKNTTSPLFSATTSKSIED